MSFLFKYKTFKVEPLFLVLKIYNPNFIFVLICCNDKFELISFIIILYLSFSMDSSKYLAHLTSLNMCLISFSLLCASPKVNKKIALSLF